MNRLIALLFLATSLTFAQTVQTHWFGYSFSHPDGSAVAAGEYASLPLPAGCSKLTGFEMLINYPGTASFDVWKAAYPNLAQYGASITGGAPPTIASGQRSYATSLPQWQRSIAPHDAITFYLSYITGGATEADLVMTCQ